MEMNRSTVFAVQERCSSSRLPAN